MTASPLDEARRITDRAKRLQRQLDDLWSQREAAIVAAHFDDRHSPNTIASATGMSRTAVRNILDRHRPAKPLDDGDDQ